MTDLFTPPPLVEFKASPMALCRSSVCGLYFAQVDWLPWRVDGYCCQKCVPKPEDPE